MILLGKKSARSKVYEKITINLNNYMIFFILFIQNNIADKVNFWSVVRS